MINSSIQAALNTSVQLSVNDSARLNMLFESAKRQITKSNCDFIELGVFRGGTALLLASVIKHYQSPCKIHLLDSWEGLPDLAEEDTGTFVKKGVFSASSEGEVKSWLSKFGLLDVCMTHVGWIEDTLPVIQGRFSLAYIDLDLYKPIQFSLSWLSDKMDNDGVIIVDDYGDESNRRFPGVEKAVSEFISSSDWKIVETAGERDQSVRLERAK